MIRPAYCSNGWGRAWLYLVLLAQAYILSPDICHALCATVKIEIQQELTLERQAFDAHMRINNGLSQLRIEDVAVTVNFSDEAGNPVAASSDPNDTSALFFIRVDSMENIEDVQGSGSVAPESSADIHWLIIPAPGAANGLQSGKLYNVGATLAYTAAGQTETIEVAPDYIFVKPMPQLLLDYFLPTDVYGDDAWTGEVEAPVPFSLGLRVSNKGYGYARAVKIESAQPKIVDNQKGLLIGFQIDGTTVNAMPATDSLLADLGDIAPGAAATARWIMSCSLSGRFVAFAAEFSHADELGGKLTSLIAQGDVRTHFLVRDVLVDAPGRDTVDDFLAKDDDVFRVYESDGTQTDVTDQSAAAVLSSGGADRVLTTPATAGFMYAQVPDPFTGSMLVKEAIRADGKRIKPANVWLSKTRAGSGPWQYFINVFDYNTPGSYTLVFQNPADLPQPPVIMAIPERTRVEGQQLSFLVESSDPNGTIPALSAERLPVGATFVDQHNGSGIFDWTPAVGQAGRYTIKFIASDGVLQSSRQAVIRIFSADDTDGDGIRDSWEMEHFGTLERDGSGDFDGDGICDLDEFLNGLDPRKAEGVPGVPEIIEPQNGARVDRLTPTLEIGNSVDAENDPFTYTFEVYADPYFNNLVAQGGGIEPQEPVTSWTVPISLTDNHRYYFRVKAVDGTGSSNWAYGQFFVDTGNDIPTAPRPAAPADGIRADSRRPRLTVDNSTDPDDDTITYTFEVYADSALSTLLATSEAVAAGIGATTSWVLDVDLPEFVPIFWRAVAADGRGGRAAGPPAAFEVDTANAAPAAPVIAAPQNDSEIGQTSVSLAVENVSDPGAGELTYTFELDTDPNFSSGARQVAEHVVAGVGTTVWQVDGLTDNTRYYWRAKADDGLAQSPWAAGSFFVNSLNEAPGKPVLKNPGIGAWVSTLTPALSAHPVEDADADSVSYRFEIYADAELTQTVAYTEEADPLWTGMPALNASRWYHWRVQAADVHGITGEWSQTGSFFVKIGGEDQPPQITFIQPAAPVTTNGQAVVIRWSDRDPDSNAGIALYYDTDDSGADGVPIVQGIAEDPDGDADYYTWDISALEGTFHIYAIIADATTSRTVYCPVPITIDRTAPTISAEPPGGDCTDPLSVALSSNETAAIYYTLDGSEPTIASSVYAAPLRISQNTILRFMGVDAAGNQCSAATEQYSFQPTDITLTLSTDKGRVLQGIPVYAFTAAGVYTGKHTTTDGAGQVHFAPADFTAGDYKFRADYLGRQFWSAQAHLPDTRSIPLTIGEEAVTVTVTAGFGPASGVKVYLFSATGAYLGVCLTTDADGRVTFDLPAGMEFTFRADLLGNQFWSGIAGVTAGDANEVPVDAGGGRLRVAVEKAADSPLAGINVYLFNTAGSYLDRNAVTATAGEVGFKVPEGTYRLRADYLGYQFWSSDTPVTTDTLATITVAHQQIQVTVQGCFQQQCDPLDAVPVYLFTPAGSYVGRSAQTDTAGRAWFELPQKAYKFRADVLGRQFWSEEATWQDAAVNVPMTDARVTVSGGGEPLAGVQVYLFSVAGSYLGRSMATDGEGRAVFRVPAGSYKFRADYQGGRFWSAVEDLPADQLSEVGISTGGGRFTFSVSAGDGRALGGVPCYVFDDAGGSYLGLSATTDGNGAAGFNLADGRYKVRVDYLRFQFWSEPIDVPAALSAELNIPLAPVEVSVLDAAGPLSAVRVYLFKQDGTYLGRYLETDGQSKALFELPCGVTCKFRADVLGRQFWSGAVAVPAAGQAQVAIDTGGGRLELRVQDGAANPMPDLDVYLYSEGDAYLGLRLVTDSAGRAAFNVPEGSYKLRVDYLGYSFWTEATQVSGDTAVLLPIDNRPATVTLQGSYQGADTPLAGVRLYLFTPTKSYLARFQDTDAAGRATFILPSRDYLVRADYMGRQYWSGPLSGAGGDGEVTLSIPMGDARVSVTGAGLPRQGIPVYFFSESGAYLGVNAVTDAAGEVTFRVPADTYQFRADYQGNKYWSGPQVVSADQASVLVLSVGGGSFTLNVARDGAGPMAGVSCYVFSEAGAYLGLSGATNDQGQVFFDLAQGVFKFRADYLGYQYWSQPATVPASLAAGMQIPHRDVAVTLSGRYLGTDEPLSGQPVYLFAPGNRYMGLMRTTDDSGRALFSLPDQEYTVRADYLGAQYWSPPFRSQDTAVEIAQGAADIRVVRGDEAIAGVRVYLFNTAGSYLGRYHVMDDAGMASFILPAGTYRFRADVEGGQHWSADIQITADGTSAVGIDVQ